MSTHPVSTLLSQLESAVERYGQHTVTDPVALGGALRAGTEPPPEPQIEALAAVAATEALPRLRAALAEGATPEQALAAGTDAATQGGCEPSLARRNTALLGAALGLLPRTLTPDTPTTDSPTTHPDPTMAVTTPVTDAATTDVLPRPATPAPGARTRRRLAAALGVLAALGVAAATALVALPFGRPAAPPATTAPPVAAGPPPASAPGPNEPTDTADPTPQAGGGGSFSAEASTDLDAVFTDPTLRAFAQDYLHGPGVRCKADTEAKVNVAATVTCDLGGGKVAFFTRMLSTDVMRDLRRGYLSGHLAQPGMVRSLPWKFVAGRPGVRTGIPVAHPEPGEGVRVRFIATGGAPMLYFDQDSTACTALFGLYPPAGDPWANLDALRDYWANPAAAHPLR